MKRKLEAEQTHKQDELKKKKTESYDYNKIGPNKTKQKREGKTKEKRQKRKEKKIWKQRQNITYKMKWRRCFPWM